jgi:hypothetical protein
MKRMARQKKVEELRTDKIPVISFVNNNLFYRSKRTGRVWDFMEFGAKDYMDLDELVTMRSASPKFLTEPWLIILDDKVVEHLGLTDLYNKIVMPDKIDKLFEMKPSEFSEILNNAPSAMKQLIISRARTLIAEEKLYDRRIISAIENKYGVELE